MTGRLLSIAAEYGNSSFQYAFDRLWAVNEEDLSTQRLLSIVRPESARRVTMDPNRKSGPKRTDQDTDMNVRTTTGFILLAVVLMASAGGIDAAEGAGQGVPYTGPDTSVTSTA